MAAVRRIVLSDLSPSEKERFFEFLLSNKVEFLADPSNTGNYVATIRVVPPAPSNQAKKRASVASAEIKDRKTIVEDADKINPRDLGGPMQVKGPPTSVAPPPLLVRRYSRFCEALFPPAAVPKTRGVSQLLRFVDEVYDARFTRDAARVRSEATGELNVDDNSRPTAFPDFVVDFAAKKYGLKRLVNQSCWDMAYSVDQLRVENPGVELFGRFLEESFDTADLLFFLFARSVVERELAQGKSRGIKGVSAKTTVMELDARQCVNITRIIFGGEQPQLQDTMLQRLDSEMLKLRGAGPEPVLEVNTFLGIATTEYHSMRGETGTSSTTTKQADAVDAPTTQIPDKAQANQRWQAQGPALMGGAMSGMAFGGMDLDGHEQVEGMARHLLDSLEGQGHSSGVDMRQVYDWAGQIVSRRRDIRREARGRWAALEPDQEPGSPGAPGGFGSAVSPGADGTDRLGDVDKYLRSIHRYRNEIREHQEGLNRDGLLGVSRANLNEVPADITALSGEEFEEDLEENIRRILGRATEELAGHTIKSMVSLEDLGPRTVATLRAALAEEFSSEADLLMEALVAQDFDLWLDRLHMDHDIDEAARMECYTNFDELQAEFKGVLSRDISVESVWRICIQLTGTEPFLEAIQKRAAEMLNAIPGKQLNVQPRPSQAPRLSQAAQRRTVTESLRSPSPSAYSDDRDVAGMPLEEVQPEIEVTPPKQPTNVTPPPKQQTNIEKKRDVEVAASKAPQPPLPKTGPEESAGSQGPESNEAPAIVKRGSFSANPMLVGQSQSAPDGPSEVDTSALERRLSQLRGES